MVHPNCRFLWSAVLLVIFACANIVEAASAKKWRRYRDAGRSAIKSSDFEQALASFQLALEEAKGWKGTDVRYLQTVSESAHLHVQLRQFDSAIAIYQEALKRLASAKGAEKLIKGVFLVRLGTAYLYNQKLDEAAATFEEARQYVRERFGDDHILIGHALQGLAAVKVERKQSDDAIPLLMRALWIAKRPFNVNALGTEYGFPLRENTSSIAEIQNTLGIVYSARTNHAEAEKWFGEAVEILERNRGKTSPELDPVLKNLAQAYHEQGKSEKAEEALLRSLAISERMDGGQISYSQAAYQLGRLYPPTKEAELTRVFNQLLDGSWRSHRPENFLLCLRYMSEAAGKDNWQEGRLLMDRGIAVHEAKFGADNERLPEILRFAAEKSKAEKLAEDEERYLQKWMASIEKSGGENSVALADPIKLLAENYTEAGAHDKAEQLYARQVTLMKGRFGETDSRVANALDDLAGFLERVERREDAEKTRAEANRVRTASLLGN